jgi:glycosyltransferase involved in cell wall biosynthesis
VRVAWFSPLPPTRSGIAADSAELLPLLAARGHQIDTFTTATAADFVWKQRRAPYDLSVYQLGNAECHDYMWAYLFRYPGLVTLHDAQLHQSRALALTRRWKPRRDDYRDEFRANHPEAPADIANVVVAGLGGSLFHLWPFVALVIESARLTVVHNHHLREELQRRYPAARLDDVPMGVRDPLEAPVSDSTLQAIRQRLGIPLTATVVAAFGGVTREKRLDVLFRAVATLAERHTHLHVMLAGPTSDYYDSVAEAQQWGLGDRVHLAGYVPDTELPAYLAAADVCACMRWPSNGETSASWLRCLAAGRPTIVTDLEHLCDVPTVDPRGWRPLDISPPDASRPPVAVSIELIDELHTLELALDRLAADPLLRSSLGTAARAWWQRHHQLDTMAAAYDRVLSGAAALPSPKRRLPQHLIDDGWRRGHSIGEAMGIGNRLGEFSGR